MKAKDKTTLTVLDLLDCLKDMNAGRGKWVLKLEDDTTWVVKAYHKRPWSLSLLFIRLGRLLWPPKGSKYTSVWRKEEMFR